jgi:signal transduction histidine kinase
MRFFRRSLIMLGIAAMLPTIVFAAVGFFLFFRAERTRVETETLNRSTSIVALADAALRADIRVLDVLSSSLYFDSLNWAEFAPRIRRVLDTNAHWLTIYVYDPNAGTVLIDARFPFTAPKRAAVPGTETALSLGNLTSPVIGGITRSPEPVIHIYVPVVRDHAPRYWLIAAIRTDPFQEMLQAHAGASPIAALVDRNGNFIARTRDYERRVGTPATQHVRNAIHAGKYGIYKGTTWEGLQNYTAFRTSAWSGWSAHIAIASALIDRANTLALATAGLAGVGAIVLAAVLVILVLRDMAERRRAEETLRQSQKMEAVGQLTGGIAHDFNNLLTAIIGNLDMIRSRATDNERLQRLAENALEAARRGAKLTSQLLAFSRNQRMQLVSVDLDTLLNGMSALLKQSLGPTVTAQVAIDPNARFVMSDPNQLELALLNLAVNARDAMPEGGTFTISTRPAIDLDLRDLPRRPYVEIRVADTGTGMTEQVRARAIEPFFTTKQVGHGTGLGLSQVYGVARESGGTSFIESELGRGTIVRIVLPTPAQGAAHPATVRVGTNTPTLPAPQIAAATNILLVDDDRQVRRFIGESLRNLGYKVVDVANGQDALAQLGQMPFDLLVVDFAMPGMNGAEVARAARQAQPTLKILIVSGYADSDAIEPLVGTTPLLRKPFDVNTLSTTVAEILRG